MGERKACAMNQVNVADKVVFLTGGAGGLARALASLLLTRGAKVFLMDRAGSDLEGVKESLIKARTEAQVCVGEGDVRERGDWEKSWDLCTEQLGQVDILVNIAGGQGGRVVSVSSTCGVTCQGDMYATPAYTASKHAVTALTRTMGHKFWVERTGVSVVAVAPYYIETPFL